MSSSSSDRTAPRVMLECAAATAAEHSTDPRSATNTTTTLLQDQLKDYAERLSAVSTVDI